MCSFAVDVAYQKLILVNEQVHGNSAGQWIKNLIDKFWFGISLTFKDIKKIQKKILASSVKELFLL